MARSCHGAGSRSRSGRLAAGLAWDADEWHADTMIRNPIELARRLVGARLRDPVVPVPIVRGVDYPSGIAGLDIPWLKARLLRIEVLAGATDDELRDLRRDAQFLLELEKLKKLAEGGPQRGG